MVLISVSVKPGQIIDNNEMIDIKKEKWSENTEFFPRSVPESQ